MKDLMNADWTLLYIELTLMTGHIVNSDYCTLIIVFICDPQFFHDF